VTQFLVGSVVLSAWQLATLVTCGVLPPKVVSLGGPSTPRVGASQEVAVRVPCLKVKTRGSGTGLSPTAS
jgi:hypothetical protein